HFAQDVCGRVAQQLLPLDPLQQVRTRRPELGMEGEAVNKRVGVHEYGFPGLEVREGHGCSGGGGKSSSGAVAAHSISRGSVQPMPPAVAWTRPAAGSMVRRTFSCSLRGNG